jgi:hypothetical protein
VPNACRVDDYENNIISLVFARYLKEGVHVLTRGIAAELGHHLGRAGAYRGELGLADAGGCALHHVAHGEEVPGEAQPRGAFHNVRGG